MRVLATNDAGVYAVEVGAGLQCAVHLDRQQWSPLAADVAAGWRPVTRDDSDRLFPLIRSVLDRGRQTIALADDGKGPYGKAATHHDTASALIREHGAPTVARAMEALDEGQRPPHPEDDPVGHAILTDTGSVLTAVRAEGANPHTAKELLQAARGISGGAASREKFANVVSARAASASARAHATTGGESAHVFNHLRAGLDHTRAAAVQRGMAGNESAAMVHDQAARAHQAIAQSHGWSGPARSLSAVVALDATTAPVVPVPVVVPIAAAPIADAAAPVDDAALAVLDEALGEAEALREQYSPEALAAAWDAVTAGAVDPGNDLQQTVADLAGTFADLGIDPTVLAAFWAGAFDDVLATQSDPTMASETWTARLLALADDGKGPYGKAPRVDPAQHAAESAHVGTMIARAYRSAPRSGGYVSDRTLSQHADAYTAAAKGLPPKAADALGLYHGVLSDADASAAVMQTAMKAAGDKLRQDPTYAARLNEHVATHAVKNPNDLMTEFHSRRLSTDGETDEAWATRMIALVDPDLAAQLRAIADQIDEEAAAEEEAAETADEEAAETDAEDEEAAETDAERAAELEEEATETDDERAAELDASETDEQWAARLLADA